MNHDLFNFVLHQRSYRVSGTIQLVYSYVVTRSIFEISLYPFLCQQDI